MPDRDKSRKSLLDHRIDENDVEARGEPDPNLDKAGRAQTEDFTENPVAPKRKKGFMEKLQRHIAAVVYAEAGEFESAQEFLEPRPRPKSILLVIEGDTPDQAAISYSLGLCTRMDAELDILLVIEKSIDEGDHRLLSEKMVDGSANLVKLLRMAEEMKVPFKVTVRIGEVSEKLTNYAKRHRDVAMIVLDSPKTKEAPSRERTWRMFLRRLSRELSVPITTVRTKAEPSISH